MRRYKVLYREGARAQNMYILLDGQIGHTSLVGEVQEALRVQTCRADGSAAGVSHALPVGQETLTNVSRMTTATALSKCGAAPAHSHHRAGAAATDSAPRAADRSHSAPNR